MQQKQKLPVTNRAARKWYSCRPRRVEVTSPEGSEKLQKVLAESGRGSRREMEKWISAGRIEVNDDTAHLGQRVGPEDRIRVDGKPLPRKVSAASRVILYNKPAGMVCTRRDPAGRPTVFDALPAIKQGRWISVGRLDIATTGCLLLTTDGELANRMMHPSTGLDREYAVRINGTLTPTQLEQVTTGVPSEGEMLSFSDIRYYDGSGTNHWYHVVLLEGRNREIRRLFAAFGLSVSRLKRVRFGPVLLPSRLLRGRLSELSSADVHKLKKILKLPSRKPKGKQKHGAKTPSVLIAYPELKA